MRLLPSLVLVAIASMTAIPSTPLAAQRLGPHVSRPRLREVPDTNDAQMYFDAGVDNFRSDPSTASAAFYWAARLNPGFGDAIYGRRAALLARDRTVLANIMSGNPRRNRSESVRRLDSLQFRALMLNPFLYRRLDAHLFTYYLTDGKGLMDPDLQYEVMRWVRQSTPVVQGWYAYGQGNFDSALKRYGEALASRREDKASIRLERARIFGMRNAVDSAVSEFRLALDDLRAKDEKDLVAFYDSKAQAEFSIAVLLESAERTEEARDAYGRALQEDLSYYPAHMRLGLLALSLKDTATAVSELALAAQIAVDEPFIRYMNGYVLGAAGKHAESIAELRKAVELEPYFALPNLLIGLQYERLAKGPEAVSAYQRYLSLASARDTQRPYAVSRLRELEELLASAPRP